jgi:hypothetical protein
VGHDPRISDLVFEGVVVHAIEARDIGAGAAHVEGDDAVEARGLALCRGADHAAGGAAEEAVLGTELARSRRARRRWSWRGEKEPADARESVMRDR